MKILHTADWHLGKKLDFFNRLEEQKEVLLEIIQIAHDYEVDMVVVAGDLFDNFTPSNEAMELLYKTLNKLSRHGKVPVIAIAGNHDSPDRINVPDVLARENGILFIGYPTDEIPLLKIEDGFEITRSEVGFIEIKLPNCTYPTRVLHTAFANEMRLKECFAEDKQQSLQETLQRKWCDLADKYCDTEGVNLLTTHLFIQRKGESEIQEPDGEKPLKIGNADVVYSEVFPKKVQYVALGHLHGFQNVGSVQPAIYSSSLLRYSFSESKHEKYVVIVELEPGKEATYSKIPISGGKKLERVTFDSIANAVKWLENNQDALVELTMISDTFLTAQEMKEIRQAHTGIIHLIPQINNKSKMESQGNEIDLTEDMSLLFTKYFQSKNNGQQPNEEVLNLLNEIMNH